MADPSGCPQDVIPDSSHESLSDSMLHIAFVTAAAGAGTRAAPYGAAAVASALSARADFTGRISISIIESLPGDAPADLAARVLALQPHLVGFSIYSWNRVSLGAVARVLRPVLATALFVAGGPEASADPEGVRADGLGDIVVAGEGEAAMAGIVASALTMQASGKPGCSAREIPESGAIIRPPMLDPATLVSPWLDGTLDPAKWGGAAMELARGCPFRCAFCFESKGNARVRRFPLDRIAAELGRFTEAGIQEVFILDPTFNADSKRMAEVVKLMADKGRGLRYILELRAELLDRNQARMLAGLDCSVQIGLQSSDPAVLAGVDRSFDPVIFARKVRLLEEYGVVYGLDLMYGLPGDDPAGFMRSLNYALALGPNHLDVFRLAVLPGTALAERAAGQGLEFDHLAPHLVQSTPAFPAVALARADTLATAIDLLYNRGRAVLWFPAIAKALGMKASALIEAFADSIHMRGLVAPTGSASSSGSATAPGVNHRDIEAATISFITDLFGDRAGSKAGIDLIRTSGAWTRALAEGQSTELALDWQPDELLAYAAADLRRFVAEFARSPGLWLCAPGRDGPRYTQQKIRKR